MNSEKVYWPCCTSGAPSEQCCLFFQSVTYADIDLVSSRVKNTLHTMCFLCSESYTCLYSLTTSLIEIGCIGNGI